MAKKSYAIERTSLHWRVTTEGAVLASRWSKSDAIEYGIALASRNEPSQIVILRVDGSVEKTMTFGAEYESD